MKVLKFKHIDKWIFFRLFTVFFLFACSMNSFAQSYRFGQGWSVGGQVGFTKFHGDLSDAGTSFLNKTPFSSFFYTERRFAGAFVVDKSFSPYWGIRGMLFSGMLESSQKDANAYFEARYFDYTLSLTLDFTNIFLGTNWDRDYQIYGFIGMGLSHSNTLKYDMTTGKIISGREGQKNMVESVGPIGIGFSLFSTQVVSINFESSLHIVHTNKLDRTPVKDTKFESVGFISIGVVYHFLPSDAAMGHKNPYTGRSTDPAIQEFNKRRRVVMRTNRNHKAFKKHHYKRR